MCVYGVFSSSRERVETSVGPRIEQIDAPDVWEKAEQSRAAARREAARVLLPGSAPGRKIEQRGVKHVRVTLGEGA